MVSHSKSRTLVGEVKIVGGLTSCLSRRCSYMVAQGSKRVKVEAIRPLKSLLQGSELEQY